MARTATITADQIRSTILTMLAEAHDTQPSSRERFRRIVSVRKLRERLGSGDPATLGRAINAVESELVRAGLADVALPDIPAEIAEQMRQLWQAAVSVQLDDIVRLKSEAEQTVATAQAALIEATLRIDVLKQELTELRTALTVRNAELAQQRTDHASLAEQYATGQAVQHDLQQQLHTAQERCTALKRAHADALADTQQRYEGLSKQLLQETDQQRQTMQNACNQLFSQLKFAEKRITTLDTALKRTESDLANEREKRQNIAGEMNAFKAINASQRAQLDELLRAALVAKTAPGKQKASKKTRPSLPVKSITKKRSIA